jgi:hypothetical protein
MHSVVDGRSALLDTDMNFDHQGILQLTATCLDLKTGA